MTFEELDKIVPEEIKLAYLNHQTHHMMAERTGLTDFSLPSITRHLGEKIAERRARFTAITDGLIALKMLKG
jgi:hypothetical protein